MISIDLRSRVPIYEQIKNQIMELIMLGVLKPHVQLPSIRSLAQELKLNVNTVKKAFADLETAGVTYTLSGRGSFISDKAVENSQFKAKAVENIEMALSAGKSNGLTKDDIQNILEKIFN